MGNSGSAGSAVSYLFHPADEKNVLGLWFSMVHPELAPAWTSVLFFYTVSIFHPLPPAHALIPNFTQEQQDPIDPLCSPRTLVWLCGELL